MKPLPSELRGKLERTVISARDVAETGARAALEQLAVPNAEPFSNMNADQRELRRRLRAKARQLGDFLNKQTGLQAIDRLVTECAYEYWHQMLFARFLAENHLLMHPSGVSVSLDDCEEMAPEEGASDGWELAARYASRMLPQIFRPDDPVLQIHYAPEHQRELEKLLADLPSEVFTADDSLGWVYQFWQSKKKDEVNASGGKIGAEELPAVTQLFTEQYMVDFLLHNTLGSWWAGRHLTESDLKNATGEDELRAKVALPGVSFDYLRFVKSPRSSGEGQGEGEEVWTPAAGTFEGWPKTTAELKVLDLCCGSGHFLVTAFDILVAFRMREEGLSAKDACDAVLRDNLFGLEIDPRCTQIAAFALAMSAWKYPNAGGHRPLPRLNIACSGLSVGTSKEEWAKLAGGDQRLKSTLGRLYDLFKQAPILGSLIDPNPDQDLVIDQAEFVEVEPLLAKVLEKESDVDLEAVGVVAQGLGRAAEILSESFNLVATNVPYLARGKQDSIMKSFAEDKFPDGRTDLATVFFERLQNFCSNGGSVAMVSQQAWRYLGAYKHLRKKVLSESELNIISILGDGAFETISGAMVNVGLFTTTSRMPKKESRFFFVDVSNIGTSSKKDESLRLGEIDYRRQSDQLDNPDGVITTKALKEGDLLGIYASCLQGVGTADANRFIVRFWEVAIKVPVWEFYQMAPTETKDVDGCHSLLRWEVGDGVLAKSPAARVCGQNAWGKKGFALAVNYKLPRTNYFGTPFDCTVGILLPKTEDDYNWMKEFVFSQEFPEEVRKIDSAFSVTESSFEKVTIDKDRWLESVSIKKTDEEPLTFDPTQWIFKGTVTPSEAPLQVAVARLLGYRWPEQVGDAVDQVIDEDGIVCIPPVRGEKPAADRVREVLAAAYGDAWSPSKETDLLTSVAFEGKNLEAWLREKFFEQHCKLFHHRPFIWHLWDGRKDGFGVLVNYHKLDRKLLETLIYTYLGDWIKRQEDAYRSGEGPAEARLNAANNLKAILEKIAEGEPPFDLFVRWKPIHEQPIGWDPDINDGVRLNIRPFMTEDIPGGRKGAGLFPFKANIKWEKDRGREPERPKEAFPWFWKGNTFTGDRVNDVHLTNEVKRTARKA